MEYERIREPMRESNDFGIELAIASANVRRIDQEPRDVPLPIIYNDEFGKTVLSFSKVGVVNGYKAYDITYKHNNQAPHPLSRLLGRDFFFWWTNYANFFTLASDGTPMVSINYNVLASSRNYLLSLGHEIGHTHQYDVDRNLWRVLGTKSNEDLVNDLKDKYPTLESHIDDLVVIREMSQATDQNQLKRLVRGIKHISPTEFRMKGINDSLPRFADKVVTLGRAEVPVGPTHYGDFFIKTHFRYTLPAIYLILDAMGEQKAWEFAMDLEDQEKIHPGFKSDYERMEHMERGLRTYDEKYKTTAYTDWLRE